ncbi:MAG: hypothetical protein L0Y58_09960, partial [Verrucomicrobia subdivision 3 bacterium]|nr:hypothetical protein [Limisphaerales bacterium]
MAARVARWVGLCVLGSLLFSCLVTQAQTATEAWVRRYSSAEGAALDYALKVVADTDGNAFVVGFTDDGTTGADMLIIKYS